MSHVPPPSPGRANRLGPWGSAAIVLCLLLGYSAVQAPVPAVNEPHYLGKAKHLWDPAWAAGDFFLESSNPHLAFYFAVGWLTRFVSLEATAWIARIAGYGLLAIGWTMLARRVAGSSWAAVPSAAIFLLLASLGNLSGEWLVGGIEGKTFAYALLFAAIALWLERRKTLAAACLGGAVSFHPIVGGWAVVCGVAAEAICHRGASTPGDRGRRTLALPSIVFFVAALPGLIPAALTLGGELPGEIARANYIQVFVRLKHHVDPTQFAVTRYLGYAAMVVAWLLLRSAINRHWVDTKRGDAERAVSASSGRWLTAFVLTSVAIALVGVAVGWHVGSAWHMPLRDLRGLFLKFYPFRLADVFVPLALSLTVSRIALWGRPRGITPTAYRLAAWRIAVVGVVTVAVYGTSLMIALPDRNPSRMSPERLEDWTAVAAWAREQTPPGTQLVIPVRDWGFRWYGSRALYVSYKDAPQDAAGLLEWERRLGVIRNWWESSTTGRYSRADLRRLGDETQADYLVTRAGALRFEAEPLFDNGNYRVYSLR